jgi:type VI secretion system secreted protein Hcp
MGGRMAGLSPPSTRAPNNGEAMRSAPAHRLALACSTLALALAPHLASAADQIYLKLSGVEGESASQKGAIDVLSVSTGVSFQANQNPAHFRARDQGVPDFTTFSLMTQTSAVSPLLAQATATQHTYPEATITFFKSAGEGPARYLTYTLTDVRVSSFQLSAASGGDRPSESVSLTFSRIKTEYRPQLRDGSFGPAVTACWDLRANRSC